MFFESTNNSKLEQWVLQWAGCTDQDDVDSLWLSWKLRVSDDLSEPDKNIDEQKLGFCGDRSSKTFYKQNGKRNSTALQYLGENSDVALENVVSESREQIVRQQLSSKYEFIPMGCTEITEHKGRTFSCRNVGSCLYPLIMMMDVSTMFQEEQFQNRIMLRLENEFCLTCLRRGRSTLKRNCVAEQILENWLKTFLTYLEIYSLDVDAIIEAKLNELKHFGNVSFNDSEERNSIERNECWTLLMKFVITGLGKLSLQMRKQLLENF